MLFSTPPFLYGFLPLVLAGYFVATWIGKVSGFGQRPRNIFLLLASLFFYAYGEKDKLALMIMSIAVNWAVGLWVERARGLRSPAGPARGEASIALFLGLAFNVGLLGYFKYANLAVESWNALNDPTWAVRGWAEVALPIGISFYTFQAMSYLVDVYRGDVRAQRDPLDFGLFISLFPQLIAGPIVRYRDVAAQIAARHVDLALFASGARRFLIGLCKKVIIADPTAALAMTIFDLPQESLSPALAWLGLAAFTVEAYYDFSGYSDMAIGMGRMLGFRFLENFNWPLVSQSLNEMWRRWHISLGSWFRDYVYVPLGGNRVGSVRTYINLLIVFVLCGLWHGANWNFALWGLWQGLFMVLERRRFGRWLVAAPRVLRHVYVMAVWNLGWVLFCFDDLASSGRYAQALVSGASGPEASFQWARLVDNHVATLLVLGALGATPWVPALARRLETQRLRPYLPFVRVAAILGLGVASVVALAAAAGATATPFLYFRF